MKKKKDKFEFKSLILLPFQSIIFLMLPGIFFQLFAFVINSTLLLFGADVAIANNRALLMNAVLLALFTFIFTLILVSTLFYFLVKKYWGQYTALRYVPIGIAAMIISGFII